MRVFVKFDIKKIQYMNAFERITRIKAKSCFNYNNMIIFVVPKMLMTKAIGRDAVNIKRLAERIGRKVKVVAAPASRADTESFIQAIVFPNKIKGLTFNPENNRLIIHTSSKTKSLIIGRGKTRLHELAEVLDRFFRIKEVLIR